MLSLYRRPDVICVSVRVVYVAGHWGGMALSGEVVSRRSARDDVVGRRRGAVSAGAWYVRADNAIRMGDGGVCTGGEGGAVECEEAKHASCDRRRRGGFQGGCREAAVGEERSGGVDVVMHTHCTGDVRLYTGDGSGWWWWKQPEGDQQQSERRQAAGTFGVQARWWPGRENWPESKLPPASRIALCRLPMLLALA